MMTRREALRTLGLSAPTMLGAAPVKRPNILFVMTDDQVPQTMGCYGSTVLSTPNFDRLAREGVRFTNCFVTNSLCAPSRASVLTGAYSHINGIRGNSEAADAVEKINPIATYPEVLQKAGYKTAMVGKWHLAHNPTGFDYWCILPGQGLYFDPDFIENGVKKKISGYATDVTTDLALNWLKGRAGETQPWCLVFQHKAPHRPFKPAPRHAHLLDGKDVPYPATFDDDYKTRQMALEAKDMKLELSLAPDYPELPADLSAPEKKKWLFQRFAKDYYEASYSIDENLGRVLAHLDRTGQTDNTLIIYTADNGFFLGDHGWYDKRFMYEPSLRVPLLVRYPGAAKAGHVESRFVLNIDHAPTMLQLAGAPVPPSMQGHSYTALLASKPAKDWRKSMYYTYYENSWNLRDKSKDAFTDPSFQFFTAHRVSPHRGVRTERYKLIHYYSENNYWELFDLEKDPNELRNVYAELAYRPVVATMKKELDRLRRVYKDV